MKQVTQAEIIKIAGLISVLVTLPVTISLFRIPALADDNLIDVSLAYLFTRLIFIFLFSYGVLQFNANWKYKLYHFAPAIKQILVVIINIAGYLLMMEALKIVYPVLVGEQLAEGDKRFLYFIFGVVHIILLFISRILRLGIIRRESLIENERLQQQNLQKELTALRNQLNPHFLFNSLNTLNSLIRDNSEATMFVNKLSYMYRYILQSGDRDLVCLEDELKFLDSYAYLIRTRYQQFCFTIDMDIKPEHRHMEIPPMALQLLVENAVKHNEMSKNCPLEVKIYSKDNYLVVENKIHPRSTPAEGTGNGLLNLDKRYFLLRKKKIIINKDEELFSVKLPLISVV